MIPELIAGALASLIVQVTKKYTKQSGLGSLAILLVVSLVGAILYKVLIVTGYWSAVVDILVWASAVYALIKGVYDSTTT